MESNEENCSNIYGEIQMKIWKTKFKNDIQFFDEEQLWEDLVDEVERSKVGDKIIIEVIEMTEKEYEKLLEF